MRVPRCRCMHTLASAGLLAAGCATNANDGSVPPSVDLLCWNSCCSVS